MQTKGFHPPSIFQNPQLTSHDFKAIKSHFECNRCTNLAHQRKTNSHAPSDTPTLQMKCKNGGKYLHYKVAGEKQTNCGKIFSQLQMFALR